MSERPFSSQWQFVRELADDAMWMANCYPTDYDCWLIPKESQEPFAGLAWYAGNLTSAFLNARNQAENGNIEAAMWHAHRAGCLRTELELRIAHGETFSKFEAVRNAQRDAAQSRKRIPDELRREAYWRHREDGAKRIEAGRLAAQELGLSESSIRNAFPGQKYPKG